MSLPLSLHAPFRHETRKAGQPTSRLRRNLRYCTWDGILAAPTAFLVIPGKLVLTVLLTQYYHLSTTQFGIIAALQAHLLGMECREEFGKTELPYAPAVERIGSWWAD